ncbi:MAG: hypothetical protein SP1CHLAM54_06580 [Chlamydiia bacterium]|nr:hypothetical protein [Chlamydiia bacterium]MCH9615568.1 hypothetical protein [Chlamydiia bacterium]MCH9629223.1 hypothetical protein [Chlamydiia bacterium]
MASIIGTLGASAGAGLSSLPPATPTHSIPRPNSNAACQFHIAMQDRLICTQSSTFIQRMDLLPVTTISTYLTLEDQVKFTQVRTHTSYPLCPIARHEAKSALLEMQAIIPTIDYVKEARIQQTDCGLTLKAKINTLNQSLCKFTAQLPANLQEDLAKHLAISMTDLQIKLANESDSFFANTIRKWLFTSELVKNTTSLNLSDKELQILPPEIACFTNLNRLHLENNQLKSLPESFGNLSALRCLNMSNNALTNLPESFGNLSDLQGLFIEKNALTKLPESFGNLLALQTLHVQNNALTKLPESFGSLLALQTLYMNDNALTKLPDSFGNLLALKNLYLENNALIILPESFKNLSTLQELFIENNALTKFPYTTSELQNLSILDLNNNHILPFPDELKLGFVIWENQTPPPTTERDHQ